jgi:phospholipid transport system transporter-binding protein
VTTLNLPPLPEVLTHSQAAVWCDSARTVLQLAAEGGDRSVQLDAAALAQFDSSALAAVLVLRREAAALGLALQVQHLPSRASELADLYGVGELLTA